jgi:hypothetical protein
MIQTYPQGRYLLLRLSLEEIDVNGKPSKNFKAAFFSSNEIEIDQISRKK